MGQALRCNRVPLGHSKVYYWDMSYLRVFGVLVCRCDELLKSGAECKRVWISESGSLPRRCARCKSTRWNHDVVAEIRSDALEGDSVRNRWLGNSPEVDREVPADEPAYVRDEWSQE